MRVSARHLCPINAESGDKTLDVPALFIHQPMRLSRIVSVVTWGALGALIPSSARLLKFAFRLECYGQLDSAVNQVQARVQGAQCSVPAALHKGATH